MSVDFEVNEVAGRSTYRRSLVGRARRLRSNLRVGAIREDAELVTLGEERNSPGGSERDEGDGEDGGEVHVECWARGVRDVEEEEAKGREEVAREGREKEKRGWLMGRKEGKSGRPFQLESSTSPPRAGRVSRRR